MRRPEIQTVALHHPLVDVAAFSARAQAVPELFLRIDDQTRLAVIMEGAQAGELFSLALELHAGRLNQFHKVGLAFDPVYFGLLDHRYFSFPLSVIAAASRRLINSTNPAASFRRLIFSL